ncbi:Ribosome-binding factor A [subsurface metagenome]
MTRRTERLNDLIREEISELLQRQVKDPRLSCFLTITRVDTSPDLRHAKVFVSIMGSDGEKKEAMEGLASAAGFFYRKLMERLSIRRMPELSFHRDDSIEQAAHVLNLMKEVASNEDAEEVGR